MTGRARRTTVAPDEVIATATPGLVVHRHDPPSLWEPMATTPRWFVVHEDSGQRLAGLSSCSSAGVAVENARLLGALGRALSVDWTQPAPDLEAAP